MIFSRIQILGMLAFGCCIGILLSCTRAEIVYIRDPKGLVQIYPEYSGHTLPDAEYYFYNANAGEGESEPLHFESTDDEGNFEGELPVGVYRVIATNTGASQVEFTGSGNYNDFIVKAAADADDSRAAEDYTMLLQPDSVYSIVIGELNVTDNDTIRKDTVPVLLTKQLNLEFVMQDGLGAETVSMTGLLPGVYPGVYLYTREGWEIDSPDRAVNFETVAEDSDKRKAKILLFGVIDPKYGAVYSNVMELYLTMTDGNVFTATVDLTTILSDAIANNDGVIPWDIPVSIHVEKTSIGVGAEVDGWIEEGEDVRED